jgi:hypothetical protein
MRLILLAVVSLFLLIFIGVIVITPDYDPPQFPVGKKFAFTICDDTDESTLEEIAPVYAFLDSLGLRTTKTVWVLPTNEPDSGANLGLTLRDSAYVRFILELKEKGFEIALHGTRGGSSTREEILPAMEEFRSIIGHYPNIHINHFRNLDDIYWGVDRLTFGPLRWFYNLKKQGDLYYGHRPESDYYWGDFVKEHVSYVVGFSFRETNIIKANPMMPYHDTRKPHVNYWFSTSDGGDRARFNSLLSEENLDRLEEEGGACVVYTHFAKDFVVGGQLDSTTRERLRDLASRDGWFVPASQLLDYLREQKRPNDTLSWTERLYLELKWVGEKLRYGRS